MYTVFLFEVGRDGKLWLACKSLTSVQRDAVALLVSLTAFHLPPALVVWILIFFTTVFWGRLSYLHVSVEDIGISCLKNLMLWRLEPETSESFDPFFWGGGCMLNILHMPKSLKENGNEHLPPRLEASQFLRCSRVTLPAPEVTIVLYSFPGVAITKCHNLGGLKLQTFNSVIVSEARSPKLRCWEH